MIVMDAKLKRTSKKEPAGVSRQQNLKLMKIGDEIELEYDPESYTYLVTDRMLLELGEIGYEKSCLLQSYETEGKELYGTITHLYLKSNGKISCRVQVCIADGDE